MGPNSRTPPRIRGIRPTLGKPSTLEEVQGGLRGDAALVGWLDVGFITEPCTVRREGDPIWMKTSGSGNGGAWTKDDDENPRKLRRPPAISPHGARRRRPWPASGWRPLLRQLKGVEATDRSPVAGADGGANRGAGRLPADGFAPPGDQLRPVGSSMLARLAAPRLQPRARAGCLPWATRPSPRRLRMNRLPHHRDHGIAIVAVTPNSIADLFGIRPGDVLLEYNGKALGSQSDLAVIQRATRPCRFRLNSGVTATFAPWKSPRDNWASIRPKPYRCPGCPGAQRAPPRCSGRRPRVQSAVPWRGTRRERIGSIATLFPRDQVTILLGLEATEIEAAERLASRRLKALSLPPSGHPRQGQPQRGAQLGHLPGRRARSTGGDGRPDRA